MASRKEVIRNAAKVVVFLSKNEINSKVIIYHKDKEIAQVGRISVPENGTQKALYNNAITMLAIAIDSVKSEDKKGFDWDIS